MGEEPKKKNKKENEKKTNVRQHPSFCLTLIFFEREATSLMLPHVQNFFFKFFAKILLDCIKAHE